MILREKEEEWEIIKQHDHALVSWQIASGWHPDYFPYPSLKEEVLLAVRQHDRSWIPLDKEIKWDRKAGKPYDFTNYPATEKLAAYQRGIDEVEDMSLYAAILCSGHYASFFASDKHNPPVIDRFLKEEKQRREIIHQRLDINEKHAATHLKLLQFCDDLSLYICLNPPGVRKEDEFPWFKQGFRQKFDYAPEGMKAWWKDRDRIELNPFPFNGEPEMELTFYTIKKEPDPDLLLDYWKQAVPEKRTITLIEK